MKAELKAYVMLSDAWQRGFPLRPRPFAEIAGKHGMSEDAVLHAFGELSRHHVLSRIGAAVKPNMAGASTLAAIACRPSLLDEIARKVSAEPYVNHNYEREHRFNLWFVVTAPGKEDLAAALDHIRWSTGHDVIDLRLQRAYHIDLGFPIGGEAKRKTRKSPPGRDATPEEKVLLGSIQDGLPLVSRPYAAIAKILGWEEQKVIAVLRTLIEEGVISRFGCILKHRELGFVANAMVVWDLPDEEVDNAGARVASTEQITLCYRRNRSLPHWPYNLFAMVHGRDEGAVQERIEEISHAAGLWGLKRDILFSRKCYVQCGARFSPVLRQTA